MKNPFYNMLYWVKGEISDIKAMEEALQSRLILTGTMHKTQSQKESK